MTTFRKDPDARLDYEVDWTAWLGDDTITDSAWVDVTAGITTTDETHTDTVAKVWLTGGTIGTRYELTNRITTAGGRIEDRTVKVFIAER